jgi:hypothetical protein
LKLLKKVKMKISELILNYDIYPRHDVDRVRVNEYVTAMQSGAVFPPVRIDSENKWVVDGFHRFTAYQKLKVEEIEVETYKFDNQAELIWWSINWNAQHGLKLTQHDQARCINIGRDMGLSDNQIAQALCITIDKITKMEKERIRIDSGTGRPVEVKKVIANITSDTVTQGQLDAQKPFNAMGASYHIKRAYDTLRFGLLPVNESSISDVELLGQECEKWLEQHGLKGVSNQ